MSIWILCNVTAEMMMMMKKRAVMAVVIVTAVAAVLEMMKTEVLRLFISQFLNLSIPYREGVWK